MSDPREKFSPAESKPSPPRLEIPPRSEFPHEKLVRNAVPQHEVDSMAEFIAGGASLNAIRERWDDVDESWFTANWESLLARAAQARPAPLPTAEETAAAQKEAERLDVLFGRRSHRPRPSAEELTGFTSKRSIGR